jgi:magnesium chelatase family protein
LLAKDEGWVVRRPFRSPHQNVSLNALVGGGSSATPGEVSLAHHGVLFLDELPEYSRRTLEALRQPLEDGFVSISRVKTSHSYPAQMMLVAAMNPCPCGYAGHGRCVCSPGEIGKYHKRISGPLLDRVDIHCTLKPVSISAFATAAEGASSAEMQQRVSAARAIAQKRFAAVPGLYVNGRMGAAHLRAFCALDAKSLTLLQTRCEQHQASARNYHRVLRIARTLADLDASENIRYGDIKTALGYQPTPDMLLD